MSLSVKKFQIFMLFLIVLSAVKINLKDSVAILKDGVWRITLQATSGIQPFIYEYLEVPEGWDIIGNYLFVSQSSIEAKKYIVRLKVFDQFNFYDEGAIALVYDGEIMTIDKTLYEINQMFTAQFLRVVTFRPLSNSPTVFSDPQAILTASREVQVRRTLPIDPTYQTQTPMSIVNELIEKISSSQLLTVIYNVRDSLTLGCIQKIAYMEQIQARVITKTELTKLQKDRIEIYKLAAEKSVERLEKQLVDTQQQQKQLKLSLLLPSLSQYKKQLEEIERLLPSTLAEISALEFEIAEEKIQLVALTQEYNILENQLQQGYGNPSTLLASLKSKGFELQIAGNQLKEKETDLVNLNHLAIEWKSRQQKFIEKVTQYEDKITNNDDWITKIALRIRQIQVQIIQAKQNNKNIDLFSIEQKIRALQKLLKDVKREIDIATYGCFGIVNVEEIDSEYILSFSDFVQYTRSFYQTSVFVPQTAQVRIKTLNPLSVYWERNYGRLFTLEAAAFSLLEQKVSRYQNDFTCLAPSLLKPGSGTLVSIQNNAITIRQGTGKIVYLVVGGCTRIQLAFDDPLPGDQVYWLGLPINPVINDAYGVLIV